MQFQFPHKLVATPEGIFLDGQPLHKCDLGKFSKQSLRHLLCAVEMHGELTDKDWKQTVPPRTILPRVHMDIHAAMANTGFISGLSLHKEFNRDQPRDCDGKWTCGDGATANSNIAFDWGVRHLVTKDDEANIKAFFGSFTMLTDAQINTVYEQVIQNISPVDAWKFRSVNTDSAPIILTSGQMEIVQKQINKLTPDMKRTVQQQFDTAVSKGKIVCPECKG